MQVVAEIFQDIQKSNITHKQNAKKLAALIHGQASNIEASKLIKYILNGCVDQILVHGSTGPFIDKTVSFIGHVFASLDEPVLQHCMDHMFRRLASINKNARLRACQIVNSSLEAMYQSKKEYSCDIFNDITEKMVVRLGDKAPAVRVVALKTLRRLQVPDDASDCATLAMIRCMKIDTSAAVRVAAAENVALCEHSKHDLCARLKDVKAEVRVAVLTRLAEETDVRQFPTKMRAEILRSALEDREESVRTAVLKLVWKWLALTDNSIPKFLGYLSPAENEEAAHLVAVTILDTLLRGGGDSLQAQQGAHQLSQPQGPQMAKLKKAAKEPFKKWSTGFTALAPGEVLWSLVRCSYAQAFLPVFPATEICEAVLPDAMELCGLLAEGKAALKGPGGGSIKAAYITKTLLGMAPLLVSSTDVCGLNQLLTECKDFFTDAHLSFERTVEFALRAYLPLHRAAQDEDFSAPAGATTAAAGAAYNSPENAAARSTSTHLSILQIATELRDADASDLVSLSSHATAATGETSDEDRLEHAQALLVERSLQLMQWALQQEVSNLSAKLASPNTSSNSEREQDEGDEIEVDASTAAFTEQLPFVLTALQQPVAQLRYLAVACLGLLGLIDARICHQHRALLVQVASGDFEEDSIRMQALQCIADFALVHRARYANDPALCAVLLRMQESGEPELMLLAAESAAKLLYAGVLSEPGLFANLLKFFFLTENVPQSTAAAALEEQQQQGRTGNGAASPTPEELAQEQEHRLFMGNCARLQQMLSIFFRVFTTHAPVSAPAAAHVDSTASQQGESEPVDGETAPSSSSNSTAGPQAHSPDDVIAGAVPQLIADLTAEIKDETVDAAALSKILKHLFTLCEDLCNNRAASTAANAGDAAAAAPAVGNPNSLTLLDRVQAMAAAALSRELLKLGNSKEDKALGKEFIKILATLAPENWAKHYGAVMLQRVMETLLLSASYDRTCQKHLEKLLQACSDVAAATDEATAAETQQGGSSASPTPFLSLAPGLADLLELAAPCSAVLDESVLSADDESLAGSVASSASQLRGGGVRRTPGAKTPSRRTASASKGKSRSTSALASRAHAGAAGRGRGRGRAASDSSEEDDGDDDDEEEDTNADSDEEAEFEDEEEEDEGMSSPTPTPAPASISSSPMAASSSSPMSPIAHAASAVRTRLARSSKTSAQRKIFSQLQEEAVAYAKADAEQQQKMERRGSGSGAGKAATVESAASSTTLPASENEEPNYL